MLVDHLTECLIFGFPGNSNNAERIKFCNIYAKYYIYIHKINGNNNFDLLGFLSYFKTVLLIDTKRCHTFEIWIRKLVNLAEVYHMY